jgi:hypothetical protein
MQVGHELVVPGPGQCILHNIDGRLLVERADPQILLSEQLLAQVAAGQGHADMHLDGDVLTIDGSNQHVSYRFEAPWGSIYRLARLI